MLEGDTCVICEQRTVSIAPSGAPARTCDDVKCCIELCRRDDIAFLLEHDEYPGQECIGAHAWGPAIERAGDRTTFYERCGSCLRWRCSSCGQGTLMSFKPATPDETSVICPRCLYLSLSWRNGPDGHELRGELPGFGR